METAIADMMDELHRYFGGQSGGAATLGPVQSIIRSHLNDIASAIRAEGDDFWVRWFLWEACPHEGKYGDDGEMQCNMNPGGLDFKRHEVWMLQQHVQDALANRDHDLTEARSQAAMLNNLVLSLNDAVDKVGKHNEHLLDLLKNIYYGELGYRNANHKDIQAIRKEINP